MWQSLGFTAGYLALLLFVAAPLRRFGSYTIPDFVEARLHSPRIRLVARGDRAADRRLLPRAAAQGRRARAQRRHRLALLGRCRGRRRDRRGQRRDRRDARDHLRPGVPVLDQGVRDLGAGDRPADPLRRAAGTGGAVRRAAARTRARTGLVSLSAPPRLRVPGARASYVVERATVRTSHAGAAVDASRPGRCSSRRAAPSRSPTGSPRCAATEWSRPVGGTGERRRCSSTRC